MNALLLQEYTRNFERNFSNNAVIRIYFKQFQYKYFDYKEKAELCNYLIN